MSDTINNPKIYLINIIRTILDKKDQDQYNEYDCVKEFSEILDKCSNRDINYENSDNETPLSMAYSYLDQIYYPSIVWNVFQIIDMLICKGARDESINYMDLYVQAKEFNQDEIAKHILNIKDNESDNVKYLSCVHIVNEGNNYNATTVRIVLPSIRKSTVDVSEVFPKELSHQNEKFSFTGNYFFIDQLQGWLGVYDIETSSFTNNHSKSLMMHVAGSPSVPKPFDANTYYALFGSKKSNSISTLTPKDSTLTEQVI